MFIKRISTQVLQIKVPSSLLLVFCCNSMTSCACYLVFRSSLSVYASVWSFPNQSTARSTHLTLKWRQTRKWMTTTTSHVTSSTSTRWLWLLRDLERFVTLLSFTFFLLVICIWFYKLFMVISCCFSSLGFCQTEALLCGSIYSVASLRSKPRSECRSIFSERPRIFQTHQSPLSSVATRFDVVVVVRFSVESNQF